MATGTRPRAYVFLPRPKATSPVGERAWPRVLRMLLLTAGAVLFLFPFYYSLILAFQREPKLDLSSAFPNPSNLSLANFAAINDGINLGRTLLNSAIFTIAVLVLTLVLGLLAGYALSQLHWRGQNVVF